MEKTYVTWENIKQWSDELSAHIAKENSAISDITLIAVSRGGLVPAELIAYKLDIRDIRVIKIASYNDDNQRGAIKNISTDTLIDGENVYFIDDLADSGETVHYIRQNFPKAKICTLITKDCCKTLPDISIASFSGKTWIVFPWDE